MTLDQISNAFIGKTVKMVAIAENGISRNSRDDVFATCLFVEFDDGTEVVLKVQDSSTGEGAISFDAFETEETSSSQEKRR